VIVLYCHRFEYIAASFFSRGSCLNAYSADSARPFVRNLFTSRTTSGPRPRVYFAPVPASCSAIRAATFRAMPQYKLPSRQRAT